VVPAAGHALLSVFRELTAVRGSTGWGPARMGFRDIAAWCELTGVALTPWDVETLLAMDGAAVNALSKPRD